MVGMEERYSQDFVYRSEFSDLSGATDVVFIDPITIAVSFQNGQVDVLDIAMRRVIRSKKFSFPVTGLVVDRNGKLIVQTKSHALQNWDSEWSVDCKTATTFSRPVLVGNEYVWVVSAGQSTISVVSEGVVKREVDLTKFGASGMVVAMHADAPRVVILSESSHILEFEADGTFVALTSVTPSTKEACPTAFCRVPGAFLVGYSDGTVVTAGGDDQHPCWQWPDAVGIGCMHSCGDSVVVGSWKGGLVRIDDLNGAMSEAVPSCHSSAIVKIAGSTDYLAAASSDGRVSIFLRNS